MIRQNTVGIVLNEDKNAKTGSYLDYPKASELEYIENTIRIFDNNELVLEYIIEN